MRVAALACVVGLLMGCGGGGRREERADGRPTGSGGEAASNGNPGSGGDRVILVGASTASLSPGGIALIQSGRCPEAMRDWLEPAIRAHGADDADGMRHIASRTSSGGLMAAIMASGDGAAGVVVEDAQWTDTLYLEAFCLVELNRLAEAVPYLQRALAMLPGDVVYACELGNILQAAHDYTGALALFQAALENVNMLSASSEFAPTPTEPEGGSLFGMTMEDWTRRAMRGIGFQLIELGQLDRAEAIYREILAIDPADAAAMNELAYIAELRAAR